MSNYEPQVEGYSSQEPREPLPGNLAALRDGGNTPPAPHVIERRQERLRIVEANMATIQDIIADLDRYRVHAVTAPCNHRATVMLMDTEISNKVRQLQKQFDDFQNEARILRGRI